MKLVVVAVVAAALGLGFVVLAGSTSGTATEQAAVLAAVRDTECATLTGPVPTLSPSQAANAATIVTTTASVAAGSTLAERIALMVADTESDFTNDGPLPDNAGSLGLFQQRASEGWGTPAEEMNPADATTMFVEHLLAVPGWQTMPPWQAAQAVQRSSFASGANYEANWGPAGAILASITANLTAGGCGGGVPGGVVGPAGSYGLPTDYTIPASATPAERVVLTYALSKLGDAYVWGAAGPDAFDCSGLTMMAWRQVGVSLAHYTVDQLHEGLAVPAAAIAPGDLVLTPGVDPPGPGLPGHVGLYLGDGLVESAVDPAVGVVVQSWTTFVSAGLDGVVDPAV